MAASSLTPSSSAPQRAGSRGSQLYCAAAARASLGSSSTPASGLSGTASSVHSSGPRNSRNQRSCPGPRSAGDTVTSGQSAPGVTLLDVGGDGPEAGLGLAQAVVHHGHLPRLQVELQPRPRVPHRGRSDEAEGRQRPHQRAVPRHHGGRGRQGVDPPHQGGLHQVQVRELGPGEFIVQLRGI